MSNQFYTIRILRTASKYWFEYGFCPQPEKLFLRNRTPMSAGIESQPQAPMMKTPALFAASAYFTTILSRN